MRSSSLVNEQRKVGHDNTLKVLPSRWLSLVCHQEDISLVLE